MPTKVLASRFNNLKTRIDNILGPAEETNRVAANNGYSYGYGQALGQYPVQVGGSSDLIDADSYQKLYLDVAKIRIHQVGTSGFTPLAYKVGDATANPATVDKIEEAYVSGIENLATNMETDRLTCHSSQADLIPCDASASASTWNGSISHIFKVTFATAQARREYFNAGGTIRFQPSLAYSGSQAKSLDWKNMLNSIGVVDFKYNFTLSSNSYGQEYGIGHDYMSSTYQRCYYASGGGVYNPNEYTIYALELNDYTLQFKCEFSDPSYGGIDETVLSAAHNDTFFFRPNGTATINGTSYTTVQVATPVSTTISTL